MFDISQQCLYTEYDLRYKQTKWKQKREELENEEIINYFDDSCNDGTDERLR